MGKGHGPLPKALCNIGTVILTRPETEQWRRADQPEQNRHAMGPLQTELPVACGRVPGRLGLSTGISRHDGGRFMQQV